MPQYLLSVYQPDGPPPADLDMTVIMKDVEAVREEMMTAGVWVFTAGLHLAHTATTVQHRDGELLVVDGPYLEGKEHLGGFTVVEVPDLDVTLSWAKKLATATRLPIEVRPIQF
jgi:hypothetical protein